MNHTVELYIDGKAVCALHAGSESDFPWFVGTFEPLQHFQEFEGCFLPLTDVEHLPDRWLRNELLAAWGISPADLILEDEGFTAEDPTFLHALVIRADGYARWRIGVEPLELDDASTG